jgi:uncharacterized glyoxalase superfamily protein PhnB
MRLVPILQVHELEAMVKFFRDALGFEYAPLSGSRYHGRVHHGSVAIMLAKGDHLAAKSVTNKCLLLEVDNIEELRARAVSAGYATTDFDPHETCCSIRGPEEYEFELYQFRY